MSTKERVKNSIEVIGHQHTIGMLHSSSEKETQIAKEKLPVIEGKHYKVLASTMWGDYNQPTTIKWVNGETDSFKDLEESLENRVESKKMVKNGKEVKE